MRIKITIDIFSKTIFVHFVDNVAATYCDVGGTADVSRAEAVTYTPAPHAETHIILSASPTHEAIAHEVLHATDDTLSAVGIHLHTGTEEVHAYTAGYITRCIYRYMSRHGIEAQI